MKCVAVFLIALLGSAGIACAQSAQTGAPSDCSGTVGTSSQAITFPSGGNTGSNMPHYYLIINNPSSTATLAINPNGAAALNSAGSIMLNTSGVANNTFVWSASQGLPPPANLNIIASALATPFTCKYQ